LIDGGVINPLPLNLVKPEGDEIVVAVDINAPNPAEGIQETPAEETTKGRKNWLSLNWPFLHKDEKAGPIDPNLVDVLQTSYDHMQNRLIQLMVKAYPPNVLVKIPRNTCGMFDFHKAREVIELGAREYDRAVEKSVV